MCQTTGNSKYCLNGEDMVCPSGFKGASNAALTVKNNCAATSCTDAAATYGCGANILDGK